jgi:hypothetical protein
VSSVSTYSASRGRLAELSQGWRISSIAGARRFPNPSTRTLRPRCRPWICAIVGKVFSAIDLVGALDLWNESEKMACKLSPDLGFRSAGARAPSLTYCGATGAARLRRRPWLQTEMALCHRKALVQALVSVLQTRNFVQVGAGKFAADYFHGCLEFVRHPDLHCLEVGSDLLDFSSHLLNVGLRCRLLRHILLSEAGSARARLAGAVVFRMVEFGVHTRSVCHKLHCGCNWTCPHGRRIS